MLPATIQCARQRRETLQTLKGMLGELESNRLLLQAVIEEHPHLAVEAQNKLAMLENYLNCLNFSMDFFDDACNLCRIQNFPHQAPCDDCRPPRRVA